MKRIFPDYRVEPDLVCLDPVDPKAVVPPNVNAEFRNTKMIEETYDRLTPGYQADPMLKLRILPDAGPAAAAGNWGRANVLCKSLSIRA